MFLLLSGGKIYMEHTPSSGILYLLSQVEILRWILSLHGCHCYRVCVCVHVCLCVCLCIRSCVCVSTCECGNRCVIWVCVTFVDCTCNWVCKNMHKREMIMCVSLHICVRWGCSYRSRCQLFSHLQAWGVLGNSQGCWLPAPATLSRVPSLSFWE